MAATPKNKMRLMATTGAVFAITVVGSIVGAQLKEDQERRKQARRIVEMTPEERIEQLQLVRKEFERKKFDLERKLTQVRTQRLEAEAVAGKRREQENGP